MGRLPFHEQKWIRSRLGVGTERISGGRHERRGEKHRLDVKQTNKQMNSLKTCIFKKLFIKEYFITYTM